MSDRPSSTRWGNIIVEELVASGIRTICVSPGSRSTPLVVAAASHPELTVYSILDERAAAFFAVGMGKGTGRPTAIVSTSGTATANYHPAVLEADQSQTPLLVCTADRPTERHDIGANQTVRQDDLYGDAIRWAPKIPIADAGAYTEKSLRSKVDLAVAKTIEPIPGPVHLNLPFRKPLAPDPSHSSSSTDTDDPEPTVSIETSSTTVSPSTIDMLVDRLQEAERPLLVSGPLDPRSSPEPIGALSTTFDLPVLADPLSSLRQQETERCLGGSDAILEPLLDHGWDPPDVVLRFGARPTSKAIQSLLAETTESHIAVNPIGDLNDPSLSTSRLVPASVDSVSTELCEELEPLTIDTAWQDTLMSAEEAYWSLVTDHRSMLPAEGRIATELIEAAPAGSTVFVSNSMPVRDLDRFGQPRTADLKILGNRGVSGIDGIVSTALGTGAATDGELILFTGDLALYHDMNGLLSIERCDVEVTIVAINNDGGGIFQKLPIAEHDPPFTEHFRTPHGIEFEAVADLYDLGYHAVSVDAFADRYRSVIREDGSHLIEIEVDPTSNHRDREAFQSMVHRHLREVVN